MATSLVLPDRPEAGSAGPSLRPYQSAAVDCIFAGWGEGCRRLLFTLPTGTGKTVVFCEVVRRLAAEGRGPVLIIAHREELLTQAAEKIRWAAPFLKVGVERANLQADPGCDVVVGSVQTLGRSGSTRPEGFRPALVICDEAHHAVAATYRRVFERFGVAAGETLLLGCTATPERLDARELGTVFDREIYRMELREAIAAGWLTPILCFRVTTETDLEGVHSRGGDFIAGELAARVNVTSRTERVIDRWEEAAGERQTVVFCAGVEHAHAVAREFAHRGYSAAAVDGGMKREERAAALAQFRSGLLQVVTCCEILTEGFDCPEIACVLMMRPTKSKSLYMQMVGRGTRPAGGKADLVLIDVVDNCLQHSLCLAPELVGLPAAIDLEGRSLLAAGRVADRLERFDLAAPQLSARRLRRLSDVELVLTRYELFRADPDEFDEFRRHCRYSWVPIPNGYLLACAESRVAVLEWAGDGPGVVTLLKGWRRIGRRSVGSGKVRPLQRAESLVVRTWPGIRGLIRADAPWRREPITEGQQRQLERAGYSPEAIAAANRGLASDLISRSLFEGVWAGRNE